MPWPCTQTFNRNKMFLYCVNLKLKGNASHISPKTVRNNSTWTCNICELICCPWMKLMRMNDFLFRRTTQNIFIYTLLQTDRIKYLSYWTASNLMYKALPNLCILYPISYAPFCLLFLIRSNSYSWIYKKVMSIFLAQISQLHSSIYQ